jgi:hypothetical protein
VCITKEGRRVQIDEGDIEEIIIPTGTQGVDTYYIIGFHLYINELGQQVAETFVETMASATDTITETTFKEGSSSIYVSLYRVKRSGLLMDSVTKIIPTLKTIVDINDTLGSSDISAIGDGTVTGGLSQLNSDLSSRGVFYTVSENDGVQIASGSRVDICHVDNLPVGTYLVTRRLSFSQNGDGARLMYGNAWQTANDAIAIQNAVSSHRTIMTATNIIELTDVNNNIYMRAAHNSGNTLTVWGRMTYTKIG